MMYEDLTWYNFLSTRVFSKIVLKAIKNSSYQQVISQCYDLNFIHKFMDQNVASVLLEPDKRGINRSRFHV